MIRLALLSVGEVRTTKVSQWCWSRNPSRIPPSLLISICLSSQGTRDKSDVWADLQKKSLEVGAHWWKREFQVLGVWMSEGIRPDILVAEQSEIQSEKMEVVKQDSMGWWMDGWTDGWWWYSWIASYLTSVGLFLRNQRRWTWRAALEMRSTSCQSSVISPSKEKSATFLINLLFSRCQIIKGIWTVHS